MRREAGPVVLAAAILVVAAALRFRGLDWGLPWALHIDERLFVVAKAIRLERSLGAGGLPDPGITSYGILPLWLLVGARALFLDAVARSGPPTWGDPFAATVLLARTISAGWGVLAVGLAWRWGARWGAGTALTAAALVAGFPALVQVAHFGTVESPLLALTVAGLLAAERVAERPSVGRIVTGGVVLGLAVSTKAPGVLVALPLAHAAWTAGPDRAAAGRRLALGAAIALLVVLALDPGLPVRLLAAGTGQERGAHVTLLGNLRRAYSPVFHDWTLPYAHAIPVVTDLGRVLPWAMGPVAEVAALVGLVVALRRRAPRDVRLLLVLAPLLLLVLPARVKTVRFYVPLLPLFAVLAAEGARVAARRLPRARAAVPAVVALLALLHGAAFSSVYSGTDPRIAAARWLDANAGPRDVVAIENPPGYGPPLGSPSSEIVRPPHRWEILWRRFYEPDDPRDADERRADLDAILARADYLVLSEGHRAEFTAAPELSPVESGFYADLDAGRLPFERVEVFESDPRLGPWVFPDDGAEVLMRVFDHPRIEIWRRTGS